MDRIRQHASGGVGKIVATSNFRNKVEYFVEAALFRPEWARRNEKVERWRWWQEAVYTLEQKIETSRNGKLGCSPKLEPSP